MDKKCLFLVLFFYSSSQAVSIERPNAQRRALFSDYIRAEVNRNKTHRNMLRNGSLTVGTLAVSYFIYSLAKPDNITAAEALSRLMDEKTREEWHRNGVALMWGMQECGQKQQGIFKRTVKWVWETGKSIAPSLVLSPFLKQAIDRIEKILVERDLAWFMQMYAPMYKDLQKLRQLTVGLYPNSAILSGTATDDKSLESLKIYSLIQQQTGGFSLSGRIAAQEQLIFVVSQLVEHIDYLAAFIGLDLLNLVTYKSMPIDKWLVDQTDGLCQKVQDALNTTDDNFDLFGPVYQYAKEIETMLDTVRSLEETRANPSADIALLTRLQDTQEINDESNEPVVAVDVQ